MQTILDGLMNQDTETDRRIKLLQQAEIILDMDEEKTKTQEETMEEHLMLAAHMMHLEENAGEEEVELQLIDRYGVDAVNFEVLVDDLLTCTKPFQHPISRQTLYALGRFSHENPDEWHAFLAYMPVTTKPDPGWTMMQVLQEKYCVCFSCCADICEPQCAWCNRERHECRCGFCPQEDCNPDCKHLNCNPEEVQKVEQDMITHFQKRWEEGTVFEKILPMALEKPESDRTYILIHRDCSRTQLTGRELETFKERL